MTKTLFCIAVFILMVAIYAIYQRNKHYKDYLKRKTNDQRYINNDRKIGW